MAQMVAHHTGSVRVRGSSPLSSTRDRFGSLAVEQLPRSAAVGAEVGAGSNPVRSGPCTTATGYDDLMDFDVIWNAICDELGLDHEFHHEDVGGFALAWDDA